MTLNINAQAGDETRRNGDYVGLPDADVEADGTNAVPAGAPVAFDGTTISAATVDGANGGDPIVGVLYTYQYAGDSSGDGPKVRPERDATVKTSGTVVADLSGVGASPSEGDALGPYGEMLVLEEVENGTGLFEVLLR